MRTGCEKCGAEPARVITTRKHLGMIFFGKTWRRQLLLCRRHAQSTLAGDLVFGLILGWWGVLSFFINFGCVAEQIAEMAGLKSLAAPVSQPGTGTAA
jgi:hypothetical protein